ncbi:acyl-CoA dehydrogenase family member 11 [Aplysia californica]|uniref:Acyl-CoA dehydrogenase family member 11 n=1 Tax=Aplysia californica TaxID=6500 RepID=A0ABM1AEP1_APLCA|nr:acyl-CoA dehydrogenase family member 11 [Aplysia californica]
MTHRMSGTFKQLRLMPELLAKQWRVTGHRCVTTSLGTDSQRHQLVPDNQKVEKGDVSRNRTQCKDEDEDPSRNQQESASPSPQPPFAHAKLGPFVQARPELSNQFSQDTFLQSYLRRYIGKEYVSDVCSDLERFGQRVTEDIYQNSLRMEAEQPKLEQMDAWGKRVDRLITSSAWQDMKTIAAEEGLIACAYERNFGEWSRLYQMAKMYLYEPSAGLYGCPLAMTNGAAKTLELLQEDYPWIYERSYGRLTTRDPQQFWTSGQWMTEKQGGSDVAGGTETVAYEQTDGSYKLYGYKWFSSATDADVTLTLARTVDKHGATVKGTRGLSLFYLEVREQSGEMNHIQMLKLKSKLGTRQLPTAELLIDGATAYRISEEGRGVASISHMLTLTRIHTGVHSSAAMRRMVNLARDYATRRRAFGKSLHRHTLHVKTLAAMEVEARAAAIFTLEVSRLLGRQEVLGAGPTTAAEAEVLRLVVPLLKLYTAKQSVAVASEGLECFGGQGYIEDTDLPRILRDTQVTAIWEGTTNILSLDVLRAIQKSSGSVLLHFRDEVTARLLPAKEVGDLEQSACRVEVAMGQVLGAAAQMSPDQLQMAARQFAYSLARIYMGALLLDHAAYSKTAADVCCAQRWCEQDLSLLSTTANNGHFSHKSQEDNLDLVFDGYPHRL